MVRIAFVAPLTGPEAVVGLPMKETVELALREAQGEGRCSEQVELIALDDQADPAKARALAARLVRDETVVGVVGHKNSGPSAAAGPLYSDAGLAQITPSATNSELARQDWRTFFRMCADNDSQADAAARFAAEELGVRNVCAVHDGTGYGRPLADTFLDAVRGYGIDVALVEEIRLGQRDFQDTALALLEADSDLVYLGLTEIESSFLVRAMRDAGVRSLCLGADGGRQSPFPQLAGEAAEGVYETYAGMDPQSTERGRSLLEACEGAYGACPIFGAEAYDAAYVLLEALRRAPVPGRSSVLQAIKEMEALVGVTGPISFTSSGNRRRAAVTIWQVRDGQMVPISTV